MIFCLILNQVSESHTKRISPSPIIVTKLPHDSSYKHPNMHFPLDHYRIISNTTKNGEGGWAINYSQIRWILNTNLQELTSDTDTTSDQHSFPP